MNSNLSFLQSPQILAIILARGGSKRLPRKNLLPLRGKPLIAWTIEQAQNSKYIDRILVSTDDGEIARISQSYGAFVPFMRPAQLACDGSPSIDAVIHALDFLQINGDDPTTVILLQPTSPLRQTSDIDGALELFIANQCESVISVFALTHPLAFCYTIENKYLEPIVRQPPPEAPSESISVYAPNGAIYIASTDFIRKAKSFFSTKMLPFIMPMHKSIDIDTEIDFLMADALMARATR